MLWGRQPWIWVDGVVHQRLSDDDDGDTVAIQKAPSFHTPPPPLSRLYGIHFIAGGAEDAIKWQLIFCDQLRWVSFIATQLSSAKGNLLFLLLFDLWLPHICTYWRVPGYPAHKEGTLNGSDVYHLTCGIACFWESEWNFGIIWMTTSFHITFEAGFAREILVVNYIINHKQKF